MAKEASARILIIEDDLSLSKVLRVKLSKLGYEVVTVAQGVEGLAKATSDHFDLVILDIILPDKSGYEVLAELRANANRVPVFMLSSKSHVKDRVKGLEIGADDYLTKPFNFRELQARIHSILQRSVPSRESVMQVADLTFNVMKQTVQRGEKTFHLSHRESMLLRFFIDNKNKIVTRKQIAEEVWGYTFDHGTNIVDVYISYLRKLIDDGFPSKLIHTIYRQGFMLKDQ